MAQKHFTAKVYKYDRTKDGMKPMPSEANLITSGITYKVLATGSDTAETLYTSNGMAEATSSMTNPVTTTVFNAADMIDFVCDPTDSDDDKVDLLVVDTNGGFTAFIEDFDTSTHAIYIDETPGCAHHGVIWFTSNDNVATDTGVNFLPDTRIDDVVVEVVTVDASETLNVGTADTANGFRSGVALDNAGYIQDTAVITSGSSVDYWTASTYGSLLATAITGADTDVKTLGGIARKPHYVTTSGTDDDLYYTESAGGDTAEGYIHYFFQRLR